MFMARNDCQWVPDRIANRHGHIPDTLETVIGERADLVLTVGGVRGILGPNGHAGKAGER
jgi:hypothetical protein